MSVEFTINQKTQIAQALDEKMNEPGSPIQNTNIFDLVHVERSPLARGLDWVGRYSPISRTCAGSVRVIGSIALMALSAPTHLVLKANGYSEEAIETKYMMRRAFDELVRGICECASVLVDTHLDPRETSITGSASGMYAHYSRKHPQIIVYSNQIPENNLSPLRLSRQASLDSIIEIEETPNHSPEGTPHHPSPAGSPRRADFSPEGTPHGIGIVRTGAEMPHLELGS